MFKILTRNWMVDINKTQALMKMVNFKVNALAFSENFIFILAKDSTTVLKIIPIFRQKAK